jgi:K+-sensing histidine kinase KdpD
MLQEAHTLLKNGIDVKIGFIAQTERNTRIRGFTTLANLFYKEIA